MSRHSIAIAFCVSWIAVGLVAGHPHCWVDLRDVDLDQELTFCPTEYAEYGACCTDDEETDIQTTYRAAGGLTTECADYYKQALCGVCGSFSGHLYERLGEELDTDGLTMKSEFCSGFVAACDGQIDFPTYDGEDYCTKHTGGGDDLFWSYPYTKTTLFETGYTDLFPDLADADMPEQVLAMHQTPDGSMFWLAGKEGMIKEVDSSTLSTSSTVMDLSGGEFYDDSTEEGLLDFTFNPMFSTNNYFYCSYNAEDTVIRNRLSKFVYYSGDPDATRNSEEELINSEERIRYLHNGGWLGFKPSDYGSSATSHDLYWAVGDAGPQKDTYDHGQSTDTIFGSMVRISVPSNGTGYTIPSGNYPDSELSEICAIGFRGHWRCGFDKENDDLWCGDVGYQDVESIYVVECGNNYGWKRFEGSRCTEFSEDDYGTCDGADRTGYTWPVFEYCHYDYFSTDSGEDVYTNGYDLCGDRSVEGNTVIGGHVYRGPAYEDLLYGAYIFGEYTGANIYYIKEDGDSWTSGTIVSNGTVPVVSFTEDNDGELYVIDENNNIYYLPCGDLCDDVGTTTSGTTTTDDYSTTTTGDDTTLTTDDSTRSTGDDTTTATDDDSTTAAYTYLGCYTDDESRVLSGPDNDSDTMTVEACAEYCAGYAYFGLEFRQECFCGLTADEPASLGTANCNLACTGDSSQTCGGYWAISVYENAETTAVAAASADLSEDDYASEDSSSSRASFSALLWLGIFLSFSVGPAGVHAMM